MRASGTQKQLTNVTKHFGGYWIQPVRKQTGLKTFKNDFDVQLSVFDKSFDYALGIH